MALNVGLPLPRRPVKSVLIRLFGCDPWEGDSSPKVLLERWGAVSMLNQLLRRL